MPAVLYHLKDTREFRDSRILRALATAGLFGNVVRTNRRFPEREVGCQGEVGGCLCDSCRCCQSVVWRNACSRLSMLPRWGWNITWG